MSNEIRAVLEYDFQSDLGYWVHMTAHRFEWAMNAELAGEGITYRQCQILAWLAMEGEKSQAELARSMNIQPSTIVKAVDRMERDGLLVRCVCQGDRRKHIIKPTSKAVPVWKRIVKCAHRVRDLARRGLSESEEATLRNLLQRVHGNLDALAHGPHDPARFTAPKQ